MERVVIKTREQYNREVIEEEEKRKKEAEDLHNASICLDCGCVAVITPRTPYFARLLYGEYRCVCGAMWEITKPKPKCEVRTVSLKRNWWQSIANYFMEE